MAEVARLVGIELRKYQKDGEQRQYCGLHLMYLEGLDDQVMGSKVEVVSCPRRVNPDQLEVGHLYELGYEHYRMKGQIFARINALEPVEG